jgi:adhesin transport system outer membrane protein
MRFKKLLWVSLGLLIGADSNALTLKESVVEVLNTNPVVQERLKNYRATQQDLTVSESEYYPRLDLRASAGFNSPGNLNSDVVYDKNYNNYESSLILTQNLFDGFSTMHKVGYQQTRILASAYNYVEVANDAVFKMTEAYLNVMRGRELLQIANENVQINTGIYNKIKDLYDAGLTTDSEVKKIQAFLSLSRSNLTVQKNNARDTEYIFRRVLGRMPDPSQMALPVEEFPMPESIQRATMYAVEHNPSILVSTYNVKGAQELWKQRRKEYYPTIDLEVSQNYNDVSKYPNGFDQPDDRFRARLVLNYNLFRGGADRAETRKQISKINQEIEIKRDIKRQIIEGLNLSWNAYEMIGAQLYDLRDYRMYSEKTLALYKDEYDLGQRSLLDLLQSQNDVINARMQLVNAEYDLKFAKYRILDAMGLLPLAITGDSTAYTSRVNLYSDQDAHEILDTLPIEYDTDHDTITDNIDLCDNSPEGVDIMPDGCQKLDIDSDGDGVVDSKDDCPFTPAGVSVSANGCALDTDADGVKDNEDICPNTPIGHKVNSEGCSVGMVMRVGFGENSAILPSGSLSGIEQLSAFLSRRSEYKVTVVAYSNSSDNAEVNGKISKERADAVASALIQNGIAERRIVAEGRGAEKPIIAGEASEGVDLNQRIEIELSRD